MIEFIHHTPSTYLSTRDHIYPRTPIDLLHLIRQDVPPPVYTDLRDEQNSAPDDITVAQVDDRRPGRMRHADDQKPRWPPAQSLTEPHYDGWR